MKQRAPSSAHRHARGLTLLALAVVGAVVVIVAGSLAVIAVRQPASGRPAYKLPSGPLPPVARDSLIPASGDLFGAWVEPEAGFTASQQKSAIVSFERTIGRKLAIDSLYTTWNAPMPVALARWDLRNGRIPMISWAGASSAQILAGTYTAQIRDQARELESLPGPVMLRYFPEMNNSFAARATGPPSEFIAAWRYLHDIFASVGGENVHWVWNPTSSGFLTGAAQRFYPGDAYLNWIGADGYNWSPQLQGSSWRSISDIFSAFYRWAEYKGKPLVIGEFGAVEGRPGAKAAWFRQAGQQLRTQFQRIRAIVYFDSDHKNFGQFFNWRVNTSPSALTAFRAFADYPYFDARPAI